MNTKLFVGGAVVLGVSLLVFLTNVPVVPLHRASALLIAIGALLQAGRVGLARYRNDAGELLPAVDRSRPIRIPGDSIDETLQRCTGTETVYLGKRVQAFRTLVGALLERHGRGTRDALERRIASGEWTTDSYAAAYLADVEGPALPLRTRIRCWVRRRSARRARIRRTADAVAKLGGVVGPLDRRQGTRFERLHQSLDAWRRRRVANRRGGDESGSLEGTTGRVVSDESGAGPRQRATGRWNGFSALTLLTVGVGVLFGRPWLVLGGVVGIGYVVYGRRLAHSDLSVSLARSLSETRPEPDEAVEVAVTITNEGSRPLFDVRFVDRVPGALSATGAVGCATSLRPGQSRTVTYTVDARRGEHAFGPVRVYAYDLPASTETVLDREVVGASTLSCIPRYRSGPPIPQLRGRAGSYGGVNGTRVGGEGVEFYGVREYRFGDPLRRIHWRRSTGTGNLTTVEFREERAISVVLVVDARSASYVSPTGRPPNAVDKSVGAVGRLSSTLLDAGDVVGIAAVGGPDCYLRPAPGDDHRAKVESTLATHPAVAPEFERGGETPSATDWVDRLYRRLPNRCRVVYASPLCDREGVTIARQIDAHGVPLTVVSPDPTSDGTPGRRLARVCRRLNVSDLRDGGVPVVDWSWGQSLDAALAASGGRRGQ